MHYAVTIKQARSQGGRWGRSPPPPPQMPKRGGGEREREKENKVACMHVKLPPFNHFQSKIKYKFVLYVENTGHMHQITPLTTSKCKKLSLWERGPPPPPLPHPPRSLRSLGLLAPSHVIFTAPPKIKSWLRHCYQDIYDWIPPLNKPPGLPFVLTQQATGEKLVKINLVTCLFSLLWST